MKTKTITLRTNLNRKNLRDHIYKFFSLSKFKSNYIMIIMKASINNHALILPLGNKMLINLTNVDEIKTYRNLVLQSLAKQENKIKVNNKDQILITYIETDIEAYNNYLKNISLSKNLELE